jgi:predicted transcriptional regulator
MDGGRILRSWLWHRSGDIVGATKAATLSGRIFGAVLIALGGVFVLGGALVSGIWQMLIGMFIYFSARASYQSFLTQRALTGKTVSDLMSAPPVVVGPDMSLEHLVNDVMLKHPISFVPVVEDAVLLGQIDLALVGRIDPENWPTTYVGDVFTGLESAACVAPSMPVLELLTTMISSGAHKYMVCRDQKVVGVICLSDLLVYLHGTKDRVQG